jgi:hypothetical protein
MNEAMEAAAEMRVMSIRSHAQPMRGLLRGVSGMLSSLFDLVGIISAMCRLTRWFAGSLGRIGYAPLRNLFGLTTSIRFHAQRSPSP